MIDFNSFLSGRSLSPSQTLGSSTANSANARTAEAKSDSSEQAGGPVASVGIQLGERQDPETTANNILEFVSRGIEQLKSQGASDERIQARLEAAREGVAKGYAEATDMLDGMGLLSEELETDIAASRSIVDNSLASLSNLENYLTQNDPDDVAESQRLTVTELVSAAMPSAGGSAVSSSSASSSVSNYSSAASSNTFSLEVQTRDGDTVTVYYEQNNAMEEYSSNGRYSFSAMQDQAFSFSVDGELDDGEMEALNGLFEQVESLSNQFFAGNMGAAIKEAMDLGYDSSELASFSLDLSQSSAVQTTSAYQSGYGAGNSSAPTANLESVKGPLANYVESVLAAAEQSNPFENVLEMMGTMAESLVGSDNDRLSAFRQFNQALADLSSARSELAESE